MEPRVVGLYRNQFSNALEHRDFELCTATLHAIATLGGDEEIDLIGKSMPMILESSNTPLIEAAIDTLLSIVT
jgi:hypothetical protein